MKTLILMRHAKSDWSERGQRDRDRALNARGRLAAPLMANWMRAEGFVPDAALVSSAVRTRETWERMGFEASADFRDALYQADPETILAEIRTAPDCACLLVLGHNPGISTAIGLMAGSRRIGVPTAATAVFSLSVDDWADAAFDEARRLAFETPKSLV